MRLVPTLSALACALTLGLTSNVMAQTDCSKIVPPSPWGKEDQTGATNRITPAVTKAAAAEIQEGKVIPLSFPLTDGVPLFGSRFTKTVLTAVSLAPGASYGGHYRSTGSAPRRLRTFGGVPRTPRRDAP